MNISRCFINLPEGVLDWLLPATDLTDTLVIVPTRQAGRRLREGLAARCAERGTALIPPVVKEPLFFLPISPCKVPVAGSLLSRALWCRVLMDIDTDNYPDLFPVRPPTQDLTWAEHTAELIQRVRNTLAEGGLLIQDLANELLDQLDEPERWQNMANLESRYLDQLQKAGYQDRALHLIQHAHAPTVPENIKRIVVAAVPDPSPLMITALENLAPTLSVTVLIHASPDQAELFDEWGRPLRAHWTECRIDIPDAARNIRLAATPKEQAAAALDVIAEEAARLGPADLAIGVPDPDVAASLDDQLAHNGLVAFNPAGKPATQHRLYHALDAYRQLLITPSYHAISRALRHPDLLHALCCIYDTQPAALLEQLDYIQNEHLPTTWHDFRDRVRSTYVDRPADAACRFIETLITPPPAEQHPADQIITFLQTIYAHQTINPQIPADDTFRQLAQRLNRWLAESREPAFAQTRLKTPDLLFLILQCLAGESFYEERKDAQIDLDGWLELHWNDARLLIVTGMNDGLIPDSRLSDVFLPDALLKKLGLRCDEDRLARDAYLLQAMIEQRRTDGRVCFIVGTTSRAGDPLRPSRLLFRCDDEALLKRTQQLFRDPPATDRLPPAAISFPLELARTGPPRTPATLSVTSFGSYLQCPLRFYFTHVLRMQTVNDQKNELDAIDFGRVVHHALQGIKQMPDCTDAEKLTTFLQHRALQKLESQFGSQPPLTVRVQFHSICERLAAAARHHVQILAEGWVPTQFEEKRSMLINGIKVTGKIDRADYHPQKDLWRVIDYKTHDQCRSPAKAHLGPQRPHTPAYAHAPVAARPPRQWIDLQLPLYVYLFRTVEPAANVSVAYFHLPRAVNDTGVETWTELNHDLLDSAWHCAQGIIGDIQQHRYTPPAQSVDFDAFADLFPFAPDQCIRTWPDTAPAGAKTP
jgi:ATP-dependent helicase/nuclease subunit B